MKESLKEITPQKAEKFLNTFTSSTATAPSPTLRTSLSPSRAFPSLPPSWSQTSSAGTASSVPPATRISRKAVTTRRISTMPPPTPCIAKKSTPCSSLTKGFRRRPSNISPASRLAPPRCSRTPTSALFPPAPSMSPATSCRSHEHFARRNRQCPHPGNPGSPSAREPHREVRELGRSSNAPPFPPPTM